MVFMVLEKKKIWRKDGVLFEESSGVSITYKILIFSEILPSLFWLNCSTQLYLSKFIFYSLLALLYLNVQWRGNSICPMWLDESDGDNHFIVQGEWIGYLFKLSQLFWSNENFQIFPFLILYVICLMKKTEYLGGVRFYEDSSFQ